MNYREEVLKNAPGFATDPIEKKLALGALGLAGEVGEVVEHVKKIMFHGVPLTNELRDKIIKELGDVHWYLEYLTAAFDVSTEEVQNRNVAKLRARHPNGWTPESQRAKADEVKT